MTTKSKNIMIALISVLISSYVLCAPDVLASNQNQEYPRRVYEVKAGDTLFSISRLMNTTVDHLREVNRLSSDQIQTGQKIIILNENPNDEESKSVATKESISIEKQLHDLGYNDIPVVATDSDSKKIDVIKNFQIDYGLPLTGIIDLRTKTAIEHATLKKDLIKDAYRYLGVPYVWGGESTNGFDCSGFVYYMFNAHGIKIPRETSKTLYTKGESVQRSKLQPGDLVFFGIKQPGVVSHVGFYIGNNHYISATSTNGIKVCSINHPYWAKYYIGAKRVF